MDFRQSLGLFLVIAGAAGSVPAFFYRNDLYLEIFVGTALVGLILVASRFKLEREF